MNDSWPTSEPDFAHLIRMTDDTGLFEHARHAVVRRQHGYCVDDVARGLLVASREPRPSPAVQRLAECYLSFLTHAQDPDGAFHNRMAHDRRWSDRPGLGDWWGRALWGLGTAAARSPAAWIRQEALVAFRLGADRRSPAPHAMAFAGLGAVEVLRRPPSTPPPCPVAIVFTFVNYGVEFLSDVSFKNLTATPIAPPWTITWQFTAGQTLVGMFNAYPWYQRGPTVTAHSPTWFPTVAPGATSLMFGFTATPVSATQLPANVTFNGAPCPG